MTNMRATHITRVLGVHAHEYIDDLCGADEYGGVYQCVHACHCRMLDDAQSSATQIIVVIEVVHCRVFGKWFRGICRNRVAHARASAMVAYSYNSSFIFLLSSLHNLLQVSSLGRKERPRVVRIRHVAGPNLAPRIPKAFICRRSGALVHSRQADAG